MSERFIGQHHDDKMPAINNGQRSKFPTIDESHGTSGDVATEVDVHGRPVHSGRPGATTVPPGKE